MSFYASASSAIDLNSRSPLPVVDVTGVPYNFYSTPFLGNPTTITITDLPSRAVSYGHTTVHWNAFVTQMAGYVTAGTGRGSNSEVTADFLAARWQEFFYYFNPFITNEVYQLVNDSSSDNGVSYNNADYYNNLFKEPFVAWMSYRKTHNDSKGDSFVTYLQHETVPDGYSMQYRQRNVIVWQFMRVLAMVEKLNERTLNAGKREITWVGATKTAVTLMASILIPTVESSSEDSRVPDPDSLLAQGTVMNQIETYRGQYKADEQKAQLENSTLSFCSDSVAQQRTALNSFWASLSEIMNGLLN